MSAAEEGHRGPYRGPSDDELFQVVRNLRTPTTLKSLAQRTGIDDSTLSRWLKNELRAIVRKDRRSSLWVLRGYENGGVAARVEVPKIDVEMPQELIHSRWLNFYLKLGWKYHAETKDGYVLDIGQATSEPEQDVVSSEFRLFRDLSLKCSMKMEEDEETLSTYFRAICQDCSHQEHRAPRLGEFCPKCSDRGSYELAQQSISNRVKSRPPKEFVLAYLSYGYKKEMLLLLEHELREQRSKGELSELYRIYAAHMAKYDKLNVNLEQAGIYTMTMESQLRKTFPEIVMIPQSEAQKAIELTLDCARWHEDRAKGNDIVPILFRIFRDSLKEYERIAVPILNKALKQRLL